MIRFRTFLALTTLLLGLAQAHADTLLGVVVGVADGDTITVLDEGHQQHKIRLAGIDAPEKKQPFGNVAKQRMAEMVFGKSVRVDTRKTDRYGRTIGRVWVAAAECKAVADTDCRKTLDAGMALITLGLAWHYKQYAKEQPAGERGRYAFAEDEARNKRVGLWGDSDPVPPWEFRHRNRCLTPHHLQIAPHCVAE